MSATKLPTELVIKLLEVSKEIVDDSYSGRQQVRSRMDEEAEKRTELVKKTFQELFKASLDL